MSEQKIKAKNIICEFGTIEEVQVNGNYAAYVLKCKIKKILQKSFLESLDTLSFMIAIQEDEDSFMFLFNIASKEHLGDEALNIINEINNKITYGKFSIDKDGDVNWGNVFDVNSISVDDFKNYLSSCLHGVEEIFLAAR